MLKLKRHHVFLTGIALILLFYFLNKSWFLYNTSIVKGQCLGYEVIYSVNQHKKNAQTYYPIIEYVVNNVKYKLNGIEYLQIEKGENVEVLYKNEDPKNAYQYSFFGFWYYGILYSFIALVLLTILCYGFLDEKHSLIIDLPFSKNKKAGIILRKEKKP